MPDKAKSGDYTEEEMKEFDQMVQKTGRFPEDSEYDPHAESRGEPRWRKKTAKTAKPESKTEE